MRLERKEQVGGQLFQTWNLIVRFIDCDTKEVALGKFLLETSNIKMAEKLTPVANNVKEIDVLS